MAWLGEDALRQMGFAGIGVNVLVSDKASIHGSNRISVGSHTRIDDFAVISAGAGGIEFGQYVHVAAFCLIVGQGRITLGDFSGLSSRVSLYSSSDDYSGERMTNPAVPAAFTGPTHAPINLGRHVIIGSGTVVLPGVSLGEGSAVGALSLVTKDCEPFGIYSGVPATYRKARQRGLLALEQQLMNQMNSSGS